MRSIALRLPLLAAAKPHLSLRTAPGTDPRESMDALVAFLESHAPFGARVIVTPDEYGPGYRADMDSPVTALVHEVGRAAARSSCGRAPVRP